MTEAYPLAWPPGWPRARSRGDGAYAWRSLSPDTAIQGLMGELERLRASHIVISSNLKPRNVSADPRADARYDPGVAVYFQLKAKPMSMAQDRFNNVAKNARSLALAIEAMRQIERHGGGHMMERSFAGFAQLPPPEGTAGYQQKPWREILSMTGEAYGALPKDGQLAIVEARYRERARKAHPDSGGSAEAMAELNVAVQQARKELA